MTRCPHINIARVCCDPARPDNPGITWCSDRATCGIKDDARPRHLDNLHRLADHGNRAGWRAYMDGVEGSEGRGSMEMLLAAFIASRAKKVT